MSIELSLQGMICKHCATRVQNALRGAPGVISAHVNLDEQKVLINHEAEVSSQALITAVESAGYSARLA